MTKQANYKGNAVPLGVMKYERASPLYCLTQCTSMCSCTGIAVNGEVCELYRKEFAGVQPVADTMASWSLYVLKTSKSYTFVISNS